MAAVKENALEGLETPLPMLLTGTDPEAKRAEIRNYFHQTFDAYEKLFETLKGQEAYVTRADPLRHPLIFYYGHTAVFFINKLVLGKFLKERLDPSLERMCAIGVDEMSWDDLNSAHYDWPDYTQVQAYRDRARAAIDELISSAPLTLPIDWESPFWVILMGIEHERIHLETSSVLIRQLPLELLVQDHPTWSICDEDHAAPKNELLPVPSGRVLQGKTLGASPLYGWDNEYGRFESDVQDFKASKFLVSNAEYKEFIDDGGYATERWWTEEGWKWSQFEARGMPRFWRKRDDGSYWLRCMLKEIPMPWSWPVETNYLEAKAFCNWKSERTAKPIRLPSEAEWYRLLDHTGTPDTPEWERAPGNLNLEVAASSVPVDQFAFGQGFFDILGNVWQHTETPIAGFPGFQVHPLYDDFSTPTFDTKHNLIKGGSWISTGNEATRDSRYAFRRHFYQHAGFRYVESDVEIVIPDDRYETDPDVVPFCEAHFGPDVLGYENYAEKIAQFCLGLMAKEPRDRALELGCKTGRTSFELAAGFERVTGMDATARHIRIGVELVEKGYTQWEIPKEGELVEFRQAHLSHLGLDHCRSSVEFQQADIANMKELYRGYDLILINGVLERSYAPARFLESVHERLNLNGILVIACSNDWDEGHSPRGQWLGGYKDETGENVSTLDGIAAHLKAHFDRQGAVTELPRLTRLHANRFDVSLMEVSVWRKR
ncbi:MAG: 5-histidylcysteine sulfoxide synthase [Opitutales bacterium]